MGLLTHKTLKKELYGEKRLQEVIARSEADSPDDLKQDILNDVQHFVNNAGQYDDMTLIIFKVRD